MTAGSRRRAKVSVSIDVGLLGAVDRFVATRPGINRSKVFDAALALWQAQQQDAAMAAQFAEPDDVDLAEWTGWRAIRNAAAEHRLGRSAE